MYIYTVGGGFNKSDLVFSTFSKAQERVLMNLRSTNYACPLIFGTIVGKSIDYNDQIYTYKYKANVLDYGNLRFLNIEFTNYGDDGSSKVKETLTRYTVFDDVDLVGKQMEDYSDSSPKYIFYNDIKSLKSCSHLYAIGKPELVFKSIHKDKDLISDYFNYMSFCHSHAYDEWKE
jgi:hypothetical protein